jgi:hypothetical protein
MGNPPLIQGLPSPELRLAFRDLDRLRALLHSTNIVKRRYRSEAFLNAVGPVEAQP